MDGDTNFCLKEDLPTSQEELLTDNEFMVIQKELPSNLLNDFGLFMENQYLLPQVPPVYHGPEFMSAQLPTGKLPCIKEWPGQYNFELLVDGLQSSRKTWIYSYPLNKIFIDVNKSVPLQFKLENRNEGDALYVRALPVFIVAEHMHTPVKRCPNHLKEDEERGVQNLHHVLQCGNEGAMYQYDEDSGRYSVLVPLEFPPAGSDVTTLMYSLTCKGSCIGGMNRRPVKIIFTLEKNNEVVGRKTLNIRICSCPKRDKKKEEAEIKDEKSIQQPQKKLLKTRHDRDSAHEVPKKKRYLFSAADDTRDMQLYTVEVYGTKHYNEVLRYLIMLKTSEFSETGSLEAKRMKETYEMKLKSAMKGDEG